MSIPSFDDTNRLQHQKAAQLRQDLNNEAEADNKKGDSAAAKEALAQIGNLDKDDLVTTAAIQQMAKEKGLNQDAVKKALAKYDRDHDGTFDHDEFDRMMGEVQGASPAAAPASTDKKKAEVPSDKVGAVLNDNVNNLPSGEDLQKAGVGGVRITLSEANFAPEFQQAWKAKLDDYKAHGIDVTLQMGKELAPGCPPPQVAPDGSVDKQSPQWNQQFDNWMKNSYLPAVTKAMNLLGKDVNAVEAFNEPDEPKNRSDYAPGLPAEKFGQALKATYDAVHNNPNASPDVKVISGGADSGNTDYLRRAAAATPGPDGQPMLWADGVGLHPYAKDPSLPDNDPNSLGHIVNDYNNLGLNSPKGQLPIYITEASQPDAAKAEAFNSAFARSASKMDPVARSYFFWGNTYDGHPGLITPKGEKTDAYYALQRLTGNA